MLTLKSRLTRPTFQGRQVTPSMRAALLDLRLASLDVVHAGDRTFPLNDRIRAVALSSLLDVLQPLRT